MAEAVPTTSASAPFGSPSGSERFREVALCSPIGVNAPPTLAIGVVDMSMTSVVAASGRGAVSGVRDELLDVEEFSWLAEARVIEDWREDYNHHRPHSSLGMRSPPRSPPPPPSSQPQPQPRDEVNC